MVPPTIDLIVKDKFDSIRLKAESDAREAFQKKFLSFSNASEFEKIKFLKHEEDRIDSEVEIFPVTSYVENHSSEEWLLKLFSTRTVLLNIDDSENLYTGVFLGQLRHDLFEEYFKRIELIEPYSFDEFLAGRIDPYFFELDYYNHVKEGDYYKIREWQTRHLIGVLSTESKVLIGNVQEICKKKSNPLELIKQNVELFETKIQDAAFASPAELISTLHEFEFLKGYDFSGLDNSTTLEDLADFNNEKINWGKITPALIENVKDKRDRSNTNTTIVPSPILFHTINKVMVWMEDILKGANLYNVFTEVDYAALFAATKAGAEAEAYNAIEKFEDSHNVSQLNEDEIKQIYFEKLDELRKQYNDRGYFRYYFRGLRESDEIPLATMFATNCYLGNDSDSQVKALQKAVVLYESIWYYINELTDLLGDYRIRFPNDDGIGSSFEILQLMHSMVLDADLNKKLRQTMDNFQEDFDHYRLPFDLARRNYNESMENLFHECIDRLLQHLEKSEGVNKTLYIQTRLKQLRLRELDLKRWDSNKGKYTALFKEYLEIEAEYIRETKDIKILPAFLVDKKIEEIAKSETALSFSFNSSDNTALLEVIKQLCLKIDLLDESRTTSVNLVSLLTSPNLTVENQKIFLNCETVQFSYIINSLAKYFNALSPASIAKSGLFYSKKGTLLTAQNLYKNKNSNPKRKADIDAIIKQLDLKKQ